MGRDDDYADLHDRFLTVRGDVKRTLRSERELLSDALVALEKGRVEVVKDHLERVLEELRRLEVRV